MATISHIPFSLSFSSYHHYRKPLFYYHRHQQPQFLVSYLNLTTKKNSFVCFACSIKQTRVRKRVKSNEELRSEIMEFVALTGLPEGHVPSMKELSAHGRVDLANIVRRRGYKFIKELLANSNIEDLVNTNMETSASGICLEDSLTEGQGKEALDVVDIKLSTEQSSSAEMYITATDGSMSLDQSIANSSPEVVTLGSVSEEESSLAGVSSYLGEITEKDLKIESVELGNRAEIEESSSEGSVSVNHSLVLDDASSCSEREVDNVLVTEDEKVNNVDEASISENHSLVLDETSRCSDKEDANVLVIKDHDVDEASISANNSLTLDDTSSYSDREAEYVLVTEEVEVSDVDEASISANRSLNLDDTSSCSDTGDEYGLVTEDEEVNDVEEASISANHSLDTEAEKVLMTEDDAEEDFSHNYDHYTSPDLNYTNHVYIASESLSALNSENTSSIEEKTARFIQNGYLDTVDVSDDENDIPEGGEYIEDGHGGQRSTSRPPNGTALALEEVTHAAEVNSSNRNSDQMDGSVVDNDPHDETMERENQVEITRLRFMLRQKELELSKLKEEIEKEKLSLSVLQREAETEINKAQMLISEKDAELQEAEESLSGLQEVEIEYCGDGNVVEVTGSFNGWQHRVGMELQESKSIGKQKCWSTLLWLYPGTYEIKFVVDDQWVTNPQMDSVTRGHITNNILKISKTITD